MLFYFTFYTEKSYEKLFNFYVILLFFLYRDKLREAIQLLRTTNNPQIQYLVRTMKKWAKDNTVPV
jgi:intraflagellar transport protein 56